MIWALFLLFSWQKTYSPWWAFITGIFVGIIPTIRYPEILFCFAFGIFALLCFKPNKAFWHSLVAGVIGAAIPIGILCIHNQIAFGAFWKTGYTALSEQRLFGWNYFINNSLPFLSKLMTEGCGLLFALGVIGITILLTRRDTYKQGILFAGLVLPITLVYMSYFWKPDPQSMRYLLPTFYIYTITGVWLLYLVTKNHPLSAMISSAILILITISWGIPPSLQSMQHLKQHNGVLSKVTSQVEKHIEPGSILITNEGICQHLDFIGNWRLIATFILKPGLQPRNIEACLKYKNLTEEQIFNMFSYDVWKWAGKDRKVYLIANEEEIDAFKSRLLASDRLVTITEIEISTRIQRKDSKPKIPQERLMPPGGPAGFNRIFDFQLDKNRLFLVEWIRES